MLLQQPAEAVKLKRLLFISNVCSFNMQPIYYLFEYGSVFKYLTCYFHIQINKSELVAAYMNDIHTAFHGN